MKQFSGEIEADLVIKIVITGFTQERPVINGIISYTVFYAIISI